MLKKNFIVLGWSGLIVIIDQLTKLLVKHYMHKDEVIYFIGNYIGLRYIENPGMAFGIQIGNKIFFTVFAAIASILIFIFLIRIKEEYSLARPALCLVLGGAIGNLIDRIIYGKVVDFIEIGPWPIFNIADIAVTIGMVILIITVFFEKNEDQEALEEKI